jgi:protein TonB
LRTPARRAPGIAWAWASIVPIALFVGWVVGTGQVHSPELRASLMGYAWMSLPFVLGFAGAALGDAPRAHPRPDWILGVGLGALIVFVSAASMATGYALIEAQTAEGGYNQAAASTDVVARAGRVAWLGLPLAALPLLGFATRLQLWPSAAGWGVGLLPLACLAIALLIDAGGSGAEHGLAEAYPRRLGLLVAYAVLVPLTLFALRRVVGGSDAIRDGLALATALAGLMWLGWRPGLLLLAPPMQQSSAFENAVPAPPDAEALGVPRPPPPPPPPPPPKVVHALTLGGPEVDDVLGTEGGIEGGIEGGMGDVVGGVPQGIIGATPAPAPPPPMTERIVQPDVLKGLRISGTDVIPPPHLYAHAPRATVALAVHVNAGGSVARVDLMHSSGNRELDDYVIAAVQSWRFRPSMEAGRAVPIRSGLTFIFVNQP